MFTYQMGTMTSGGYFQVWVDYLQLRAYSWPMWRRPT
jgi:hypothetical protein